MHCEGTKHCPAGMHFIRGGAELSRAALSWAPISLRSNNCHPLSGTSVCACVPAEIFRFSIAIGSSNWHVAFSGGWGHNV